MKKVIVIFLGIMLVFSSICFANYIGANANKLILTINNINESIKSIDILYYEETNPDEIFDYDIANVYGIYEKNDGEYPVFDDAIRYDGSKSIYCYNDFYAIPVDKLDEKYINALNIFDGNKIKLYDVSNYDENKYIIKNTNSDMMEMIIHSFRGYENKKFYYDNDKNQFTVFEIANKQSINNIDIKDGAITIPEITYNDSNLLLIAKLTDGTEKTFEIGNSFIDVSNSRVETVYKTLNYQTEEIKTTEKQKYFVDIIGDYLRYLVFLLIFTLIKINMLKKINVLKLSNVIFEILVVVLTIVLLLGALMLSGNPLISFGISVFVPVAIEYLMYFKKCINSKIFDKILSYNLLGFLWMVLGLFFFGSSS